MKLHVAELEITIRVGPQGGYEVELKFTGPEDDADTRRQGATLTADDLLALRKADPNTEEYGKKLFATLLSAPDTRAQFREAMAVAEAQDAVLRVRLVLNGTALQPLHELRWEALRDPDSGALMFTGERVYFSRYISTPVYRPLRRRSRAALRALVVIVSPSDLNEWRLGGRLVGAIDAADEERRALEALGPDIQVVVLRSGQGRGAIGILQIVAALREGPYDILYLLCHGALAEGVPFIWLEGEDGTSREVQAIELVQHIGELRAPPRLVVLASCQSAGTGDERRTDDSGVLAGLGPRLAADAGVPAVLAMQGNLTIKSARVFIPAFFRSLAEHGQIDRAASSARGLIREHKDAWVPVLFMRFRSGGIWYEQGFRAENEPFTVWRGVVEAIISGRCTPILGPELAEPYVGSRSEIAARLAERYDYPLATHERESLPDVAQYVAVELDKALLDRDLVSLMAEHAQVQYGSILSADAASVVVRNEDEKSQARWHDEIVRQVWRHRREKGLPEPHMALAQLRFPLFLTANFDDLMRTALVESRQCEPTVEVCRWSDDLRDDVESIFDEEPLHSPTVENPLLYHLLGKVGVEGSLVVTRADYYDALLAMSAKERLPQAIRTALTSTALLFLGFRLSDPSFQALFRFVMSLEGARGLTRHTHVAVQIDPEEQAFHNPRAAQRYLSRYFSRPGRAHVHIYWGSLEDFVDELVEKYRSRLAQPRGASAIAATATLERTQ